MALLVYVKQISVKKQTEVDSVLPKPDGSLLQVMAKSCIYRSGQCSCSTVPVPILTLPTVYKSWTFPGEVMKQEQEQIFD